MCVLSCLAATVPHVISTLLCVCRNKDATCRRREGRVIHWLGGGLYTDILLTVNLYWVYALLAGRDSLTIGCILIQGSSYLDH